MDSMKVYNIDINLTTACNFQCTYCFESKTTTNYNDGELFVKQMNKLLDSDFFKRNYSILSIGLWGGEPTLNPTMLNYIVNAFGEDNRVKFFSFSNGYDISPILDTLLKYKNYMIGPHPKVVQQISYDGTLMQDINRKKHGKGTSKQVEETIDTLLKLGVPMTTKSTVTLETFKYLYDSYCDLINIHKRDFKNVLKCNTFFPTIDYYHLDKYSKEQLDSFYADAEDCLLKISKDEIKNFKQNKQFFFSWFIPNKRLCSAGMDMAAVDVDNKIYSCHGCLYSDNKKQHYITSLTDDDFIVQLEKSSKRFSCDFGKLPTKCMNCSATFCLKCNQTKFDNSKKDNYLDRWNDFTSQPSLCYLYKKIGAFNIALKKYIEGI